MGTLGVLTPSRPLVILSIYCSVRVLTYSVRSLIRAPLPAFLNGRQIK